jgi:hypothetical protein
LSFPSFVVPVIRHLLFSLLVVIVSTSIPPYEQWLAGGVVVL